MDLSYRWLQSLIAGLEETPQELAERLAAAGAPVDALIPIGAELSDVIIARVEEAGPHPNADRLSLCRVDAGTGEPLSVVCGASNVRAGRFYPFAPVGAVLPGGVKLRKAKIRGELSEGMLCSERELGLGRVHEGIMELTGDFSPGEPLVPALHLDDTRIVIDVTANRPDLLSHLGVARELAAAGAGELREPRGDEQLRLRGADGCAEAAGISVTVEAPDMCPRYLGAVIRDLAIASSPEWLKGRLRAIGLRPINNVVDATNYVLYELGQPLHAFDLRRLSGERIIVRRAVAGETILTLDGERRGLAPDMLVIADAERPVAIAGVMGGEDSEVIAETRDVLLECALFDPRSVRATRRALGLSTDASYRFERGVDPEGMERALRRAVALIVEIAGGRAEPEVADAAPRPFEAPIVAVRPSRAAHVLGVEIDPGRIADYLEPLGFEALGGEGDSLRFRVPGHRSYDVSREVDLIEEIARRHGYESFPQDLRAFRPSAVPDDAMAALEDRIRERLVALGLLEAHMGGFAPETEGDVALERPLSSSESHLRRALLPGLIHRLEYNFARGARDVRLFEIGTAFASANDAAPEETRRVALVLTGGRSPLHWTEATPDLDLWDLKGVLEALARELGLPAPEPADGTSLPPYIDATQALGVAGEAGGVGVGGRIAATAVDAPRWAGPVWGAELVLAPSMSGRETRRFTPLPEYPAIERDIALLVSRDVTAAAIEHAIREAAGDILETVHPFDVYTGETIGAGRRSVAFRLRMRSPERTLTDAEADAVVARVLDRLREEMDVERRG